MNGWSGINAWLRTSDSDWFIDEAVLGGLPKYEAEELLQDFAIAPTREAMSRLGREVDAALGAGR